MNFTINADSVWISREGPKPGSEIPIYLSSSPYLDGPRLTFAGAFSVTLTPKQAIELGTSLTALGSYHQIFLARFGIADRDATISRTAKVKP